jgi:DnaJ-class molecular chaperone
MPIIVKTLTIEFEIPDEGSHHVRIREIKDLPMVQTKFGKKDKLLFVLDTDQLDSQGNPRKLFQRCNKNLHAKSALRKFIKSVTGEDPGNEFDVETLLGREFDVQVEHNERDGRVFADIAAIIRLKPAGK